MKTITDSKELMKIEYDILQEIHSFCEANHLRQYRTNEVVQ